MNAKPLVVDLDGTLVKTDLLFESANRYISEYPLLVIRLLLWLLTGKAELKAKLASVCEIDPASLPYNKPLIDWLRQEKARGRHLVLATASHQKPAAAIAGHLGLFDEVLATRDGINLKAGKKRDLLVERYGSGGYDYIGNGVVDLPVWKSADHAYLVSDSPRLEARVKQDVDLVRVFSSQKRPFPVSLLRAIRPHQWVKNLLLFVPLFAAHRYQEVGVLLSTFLAFLVFGLIASSVYLLNDLVDVEDDRSHPRKKHRPFACGDLSLLQGWVAWPLLLGLAATIASLLLPTKFSMVLAAYFLVTLGYSLRLKQSVIVDAITLAVLYTLRLIAGAAVIDASLSFWLLTFSMFLFLSLAFMKRFNELRMARERGREGKLSGRGYIQDDLEVVSSMGTGSGYLAVLVLALYIQDQHTAELYTTPEFIWLACPLLLYWISRVWLIAHRGHMHDDPVVFAIKDRPSWLVGLLFILVFSLARVGV
ncbi:MAG: UbiA family prenyltransferase [Sedimenticola sp.]|nr:UbiA family prenyltransferase [Sedimenticola sp.]